MSANLVAARRRLATRHGFDYALILPALGIVALVIFYPIVYAIDVSLHETRFLEKVRFSGLENFALFFAAHNTARILINSLILVLGSLAVTVPLGIALALLVNARIRMRAAFRALLVLPWIISQVITALLWSWMVNPQYGLLRLATDLTAATPIDLFGDRTTAMAGLILVNVWRTFPFAMLLILAALQTIPRDLYEAAEMDSGPPWRRFFEITLPLIRPTILVVIVMLSLSYFNHIELPMILTDGGPLDATMTLSLQAYQQAFVFNRLGLGSAISLLVFAVNIILSLAYIRLLKSERYV